MRPFGYIMMATRELDNGKKDVYLDQALKGIAQAQQLAPAESEITALEGFAYIDPCKRRPWVAWRAVCACSHTDTRQQSRGDEQRKPACLRSARADAIRHGRVASALPPRKHALRWTKPWRSLLLLLRPTRWRPAGVRLWPRGQKPNANKAPGPAPQAQVLIKLCLSCALVPASVFVSVTRLK